ncbi:MAG TPA: peptidyl-prolyl cis-trans isomerase [Ignavibacteria bacterium]|nr:peptidyl-prolyl cis-trans isomerase [Ignavibacteria bacterium]
MKYLTSFNFIVIIFFFLLSYSQDNYAEIQSDTLALVNGQPVTSADFKNRFELSIYPGKGEIYNLYKAKRGFLYSMIAERLLANQALRMPTNTDKYKLPEIAKHLPNQALRTLPTNTDKNEEILKKETERIFLRDALYRKVIVPKAKVTKKEIEQGVKFSVYFYILDAFYFPGTISANKFYNLADGKYYKNRVYRLADSLKIRHDSLEIGYGESNGTIEHAFFGHKPGFISKPTNTIDGWVIFRILSRKMNKKFSAAATNDREEMIRKVILSRKETKLGYDYLLSVMKGINVHVNYRIFKPLVYSIHKLLSTHRRESFEPDYYLSRNENTKLKQIYSKKLNQPMLKFNGGELTFRYVLNNLPVSGFAPIDTTIPEITYSLNTSLKFMVQNYFLAKRANQLNLQNSQEVKYNVQMFLNAYRADLVAAEITDTVHVTLDEVNKYFTQHKDEVLKDVELRLQIFTFENLDEAAKVLNKLDRLSKNSNDTTGAVWLRASQLSELGAVLAELKKGSIYGPIFIKGKYTVFRILNKRSKISHHEIIHSIQVAEDMLVAKRKREVLNKYLARLAQKQNVKIYPNRLSNVKVTPIQMLTFRYIGFGGKIIAVPTLYPHENWIKYFKRSKKIIP